MWLFLATPLASKSQARVIIEGSAATCSFAGGAIKSSSNQTEVKSLSTLSGRVVIEKSLSGSLFFAAGVALDTKGGHLLINQGKPDFSDRDIYISYLSIPVGVFTKLPIGRQQLYLGTNVYVAWPIRGYESGLQMSPVSGSLLINNRLKFGSADPTQFHPTVISGSDYGAEAYAQLRLSRIRLGLRYSRGFKGILVNTALYDRQYYQTGFAMTVGYQL